MRFGLTGGVAIVLAVIALIVAYGSLFTVYQTQQALVVRLGNPIRVITEPGLNYKVPLIDSVIAIDKRILDLEAPSQEVISTLLISALRRVLGEATFIQVVRDERPQLTQKMREQLDHEADAFGIAVVDVRIRRADLPEQNSQAVYQRMQTERQREAAEFRAQGSQRSQEIRSKADRDVTVLVAEATSKAEQIRGEGDAQRNRVFNDAYGRDVDFFGFYRSMQAYETGFRHTDTRMLLNPDTDFFRYFVAPSGKIGEAAPKADNPAKTGSAVK